MGEQDPSFVRSEGARSRTQAKTKMMSVLNPTSVEYDIDYNIYRNPADLDSTGFFEIGPGRYSGEHWQDGFVFVWEDAFAFAEGIVIRHFPDYDHFAMNDIQKEVGLTITSEWRRAARELQSVVDSSNVVLLLNIKESYRLHLELTAFSDRDKIAGMLSELADICESFYRSGDWICLLGM